MSELLRAFDVNAVRRRLHDLMFEVHQTFAIDRSTIPHTYDTVGLLTHAEKLLRRRDVKSSDHYQTLLFRTAVAQSVVGDAGKALAHFEKGTRSSDYLPDQALFRYGIGHWIHQRNGDRRKARAILLEAREQSERGRYLRTEIDLLLGRTQMVDGDGFGAQRRFERILKRGVLELRPMARLLNVRALAAQGVVDEAWAENERAGEALAGMNDWRLRVHWDENRVRLLRERGQIDKARQAQADVLNEHYRRLHTDRLADEYGNYAILCSMLNRHEEALEASLEAVRLSALPATAAGRKPARLYRNLAGLLGRLGRRGEALAALDMSLEHSRSRKLHDMEFKGLTTAVEILSHAESRDAVPALLVRCQRLMETHGRDIPREALEEYVATTARAGTLGSGATRVREVKKLASAKDRAAFAKLLIGRQAPDYQRELEQGIGEGMGFEDAPKARPLARFLLLFAGDHFKSTSYQREFGKSQPRAKYHLQWLVNHGLLERLGTRKASSYILAFHRR